MLGAFVISACVAIFAGRDSDAPGLSLYMTDGTPNGVVELTQSRMSPQHITPLGTRGIFEGATTSNGRELFRTGGTPGSTRLIKDIWPGASSSNPRRFVADPTGVSGFTKVGEHLLFSASSPTRGRELWRTDGTTAGTTLVKQFKLGTADGVVDVLTATESFALVAADHETKGMSLWATDGTPGATTFLMTERGVNGSMEILSTRLGANKIVFTQDDGNSLWVTDGTKAGTRRLRTFSGCAGGWSSQRIRSLTGWPEINFALFAGCTSLAGFELWKTDGTPEGTVLVRNIWPGTGSSLPTWFYRYGGNRVYFSAADPLHGREVWRTDGTFETTRRVSDILPGPTDSNPRFFARFADRIVFQAVKEGVGGWWLHASDGTPAGTFQLDDVLTDTPFVNIGTKLVFGGRPAGSSIGSSELMGTRAANGTSHVIQDIYPGTGSSSVSRLTAVEVALPGLPTPANCPRQ